MNKLHMIRFRFRSSGMSAALAALIFATVSSASASETTIGDLIWSHGVNNIQGVKSASGATITSLTIPGKIGGNTIEYISSSAFSSMPDLESVSLPSSIKTIGSSAFYGCSKLRSVSLAQDSKLETINNTAFRGCERLASISFPASLRSIGDYAFSGCPALRSATFNEGLETIGYQAFYNATSLGNFTFPSTLRSISSDAFSGCTAMTELNIPNGVTNINSSAFSSCTGLQTATIGNGLEALSSSLFYGCSKLRTVSLGSKLEKINSHAFLGCERLASISFPASLRSIGDYAFSDCPALKSATFNEGLETIGYQAFYEATSLGNFKFPSTLRSISSEAFRGCTNMTELAIPDSVTEIGSSAFSYCTGLRTVTIGDGLYEIPSSCFYGCSALEAASIGESVDTINSHAFLGCERLASISFPASLRSIGDYAFSDCPALKSATFNEGLETIGYQAFYEATSLGNFKFPSTLRSISSEAFRGCTNMTELAIPDSVTEIGSSAFSYCTGLRTVTIGDGLYEIPSSCFYGCAALETASIGESVDTINSSAFYSCGRLTALVAAGDAIAEDSSHVGSYAFSGVPDTMIVYVRANASGWGTTWKGFRVIVGSPSSNKYTVSFDKQSGTGGSASVTATYGQPMPSITVPTRTGYTFGGYYTSTGGSGTQYYTASGASARNWDKTSATTLYAKWTANRYTVTFDKQGGTGGSASVAATYEQAMPSITLPTYSGYTFGGYYSSTNGTGTQYYTETGASARTYNLTSATTLYAKWTFTGDPALANALDNGNLLFGTGATNGWFVTRTTTYDGNYDTVARSGSIGSLGWSAMTATATGSGIISFRWKVSSENNHDYAHFYIDGTYKMYKTGVGNGWRHESWKVGSGTHLFIWAYSKDNNGIYSGSDCVWVDNVKWVPDSPLAPIYRFYSEKFGGHFFTRSESEMYYLFNNDHNWDFEGTAYFALPSYVSNAGVTRTYRFYSSRYRGHFYTIDYNEYVNTLWDRNWKYEDDLYYVREYSGNGATPVYRFWNDARKHHFYTTSYDEYYHVRYYNPNWKYEQVAFYAWAEADDYVAPTSKALAKSLAFAGNPSMSVAVSGLPTDDSESGDSSGEMVSNAPWMIVTRTDDAAPIALDGETALDDLVVETRSDAPDAAELRSAETAEGDALLAETPPVELSLRLSGAPATRNATLWSASDGTVTEESFEGTLDFDLPATGVWHWLRVADDSGNESISVWLRATAD